MSLERISNDRAQWIPTRIGSHQTEQWLKLEAKYGKYLYIPLDIPKVQTTSEFVSWYFDVAKNIDKVYDDVAGGKNELPMFLSVDTRAYERDIWERNVQPNIPERFPELIPALDALPFTGRPDFFLWSSTRRVPAHRDQGPWFDLPCSFRIVLYDENPKQTLELSEDPLANVEPRFYKPRRISVPSETNTFAWNNLRTKHSSRYSGLRKILLIVSQQTFDLDQYEDLMERSIAKYSEHAQVSSLDRLNFVK